MTGASHLNCGVLAAVALCDSLVGGVMLCVGSVLPDIDHRSSFLGRCFPFVPRMLSHRGFTHSWLFLLLAWLLDGWLFTGVALHIGLDFLTKEGVRLLWPLDARFRMPFIARNVVTGGAFEAAVLVASYIGIIYLIIDRLCN